MALQICPNCKEISFTWSMGEGDLITIWNCHRCHYTAHENESFERECVKCKRKTESLLEDDIKVYWWCSSCNNITIITTK